MSYVKTLRDYTPIPRFDNKPFTYVRISEGPDQTGPWTEIAQINLVPVDTDPTLPITRSFTVEDAVLEDGWYTVTFFDVDNDMQQPTAPVRQLVEELPEYYVPVAQIGALLRARTVDAGGNEVGTFTNTTRPTAAEAATLASQATQDLENAVGTDIPDALIQNARALVALRAAMLVELSYFPEQVAAGRSAYAQYKELWDEAIGTPGRPGTFVVAVQGAIEDDSVDVEGGAGYAHWYFPPDPGFIGLNTPM